MEHLPWRVQAISRERGPKESTLVVANRPLPYLPSLISPLERWKTGESSYRLGGDGLRVQPLSQSRLRLALSAQLAIQRNPLPCIPQVCGSELRLPPTPVHAAKPLEMQLASFELLEGSSSAPGDTQPWQALGIRRPIQCRESGPWGPPPTLLQRTIRRTESSKDQQETESPLDSFFRSTWPETADRFELAQPEASHTPACSPIGFD